MFATRLNLIAALWVGLACIAPPHAQALYFRLDGDRLWLQAEKTPLVEVLRQFTHAGVTVRMDPAIQATVHATYRGVSLDDGLSELLGSYDYLVTWKMLRGPLGRVPKLQEIEVFHPGSRNTARPLFTPKRSFDTTRGVTGDRPEFIRDELLIGGAFTDVAAMHDQAFGADRCGRIHVLLQQLPTRNPDAIVRTDHVDQVGRVHVNAHSGGGGFVA